MPLKIAILGFTEKVEKLHVPALNAMRSGSVFSAVADPVPARLEKAAKNLKGAGLYGDENLLLEKEKPDAVLLSGPSGRNRVLKILNANLNALCEGPLSLGLSELDEVLDKARQRGKKLSMFRFWPHHPQVKAAMEAVSQDILGGLRLSQWSFFPPAEEEKAEWDSFQILTLLRNGKNPVSLFSKVQPDGISDTSVNFMDSSAQIHVSQKNRLKKVCALMAGDKGILQLDGRRMAIERPDVGCKVVDFGKGFWESAADPALALAAYLEFEKSLGDPAAAENAMKETSLCLRLVSAARKSAASGKQVPV